MHFTDDTLFGAVGTRPELSPRDRSLATIAALATAGNTDQLSFPLGLARENGVTTNELTEAIAHLAFYAGWPRAMSAMAVAKRVLGDTRTGTTKQHRMQENAAADVHLTSDEVTQLTDASTRIEIQGGRYRDFLESQTNLLQTRLPSCVPERSWRSSRRWATWLNAP